VSPRAGSPAPADDRNGAAEDRPVAQKEGDKGGGELTPEARRAVGASVFWETSFCQVSRGLFCVPVDVFSIYTLELKARGTSFCFIWKPSENTGTSRPSLFA
jgi:hypothetical protein